MKKVKLFTHTDLDGIGCSIVAFHVFEKGNVDVEYCDYENIDEKVKSFLEEKAYKDYDYVFITDISLKEETGNLIEGIDNKEKNKFQLLDHHNTALWMNEKYSWAVVNSTEICVEKSREYMKSCGTSLFYNFLWEEGYNVPFILDFIEMVRRYDTWEWDTIYSDLHPKRMNDLFYLIGRNEFVFRFLENPSIRFTETELMILNMEQEKINKYIEAKKKEMFEDDFGIFNVGICFSEQYHSQLGKELAKSNSHLDFIIMINLGSGKISYRGIHGGIDLGAVAKKYGGGGHPKAAGSSFDKNIVKNSWKQYFVEQ